LSWFVGGEEDYSLEPTDGSQYNDTGRDFNEHTSHSPNGIAILIENLRAGLQQFFQAHARHKVVVGLLYLFIALSRINTRTEQRQNNRKN